MKAGPCFPFIGNARLNIKTQYPLKCFELLIIPEIAELTSRETNCYAQEIPACK